MRVSNFHVKNLLNTCPNVSRVIARADFPHPVRFHKFGKSTVARCVRENRALCLDVSGEFDGQAGSTEAAEAESFRIHRIEKIAGGEHRKPLVLSEPP